MTNSEFKVNVTADISALQASLKSVQAELDKFKKTADGAATATKGVEKEANRGRLAAFAFGQVLRDSGFFAQSFSLGILAISNNIPILIDQLVLLSGVSQAVGSALSLLGSLLTAGLTIWAYSSMAVKENKETIEEYIKSLDDLKEAQLRGQIGADEELRRLRLLRIAAQDDTLSRRERLKAVKELQSEFPDYYANLSAETIMAGRDADANNRLAASIIAVANAKAREELIRENRKVELADSQKLIDLQAEVIKQRRIIEESYKEVGSLDAARRRLAATNKLRDTETEIYEIAKRRNKARDNAKTLEEQIVNILKNQKSITPITGNFGELAGELTGAAKVLQDLSDRLKVINSDITLSGAEIAKQRAEAYKSAINDLVKNGVDPASEAIKRLQSAMATEFGAAGAKQFVEALDILRTIREAQDKVGLKPKGTPQAEFRKGAVKPVDITGDYQRQFTDLQLMMFDMIPTIGEMTGNIVTQVANGFGDIIQSFADGLGQLLTGKMGIKDFGQSIIQSISGFLSQLGRQMIAFGAATVAFGLAQKVLQEDGDPASKIKAGFGLIAAGAALSAAGGAIRSAAGGSSSSTSASPTPTFGSLRPRSATAPTSTSAMAINGLAGGGTLETRVSGNDLVILLDRASNNRNKYF